MKLFKKLMSAMLAGVLAGWFGGGWLLHGLGFDLDGGDPWVRLLSLLVRTGLALALGLWLALTVAWAPYQAARRTAAAAGLGLRLPLCWRAWARLQAGNTALRIVSLGALAPYAAARESAFVFARLEEARRRSKRARAARLSAGVRFTPLEMKAGSQPTAKSF